MKSRWFLQGIAILLAAAPFLCGCSGGDDLPRQKVSGTITLNGQPLESGSIQFQPAADADAAGAVSGGGALISSGRYAIERDKGLTPGKYKVLIFSHAGTEVDESEPPGESVAQTKVPTERIPREYNEATTLTAQVSKEKENILNYDLKK